MDTSVWEDELDRVIIRYYEEGLSSGRDYRLAHKLLRLLLDNDPRAAKRFVRDVALMPAPVLPTP